MALRAVHEDRNRQEVVANWEFAAGEDCARRDAELMRASFALPKVAGLEGIVIETAAARANRRAFGLRPADQTEGFAGVLIAHARNRRYRERPCG